MAKLERDKLIDIEIHVGDPNEQVRDSLRSIMRAEGMRRISAYSRMDDLLEALKKAPPDLLLLADDFDDNVFDFVRDVRHYRQGSNPFVLITMLVSQDNDLGIKKAVQAGADDVLIKPLSPGRFLERLAHLAFNRLLFIATTDYVGPERRRSGDRPSMIPRIDVVNTLREKVEGARPTTVQLTRAINLGMREVLVAQLDSFGLKVAYLCNQVIKSWTEKDLTVERDKQFALVVEALQDASRHAKRLRRDALADAWTALTETVHAIERSFNESETPDLVGLQALPKAFEAAKAAFPAEDAKADGSRQAMGAV